MGRVRTVSRDISPFELGITLIHEHLLLQHQTWPRDAIFDDRNLAVTELSLFARYGMKGPKGWTLVELTSRGLRGPAHAEQLHSIAEETDVHIVIATGFHKKEWHPQELSRWSQREVEDSLTRDLLQGVGSAKIKAGVIGEIGMRDFSVSAKSFDRNELKVLKASAATQRQTSAPIYLHLDNDWRKVCRNRSLRSIVLEYLRDKEGVDLNRVIVSDCFPLSEDEDFHRRPIAMGAYVSFDSWRADIGHATIPEGDYQTYARAIKRLVADEGCPKRSCSLRMFV